MRITNRLARLLRERQPTVGMWISPCDSGVLQVAAATACLGSGLQPKSCVTVGGGIGTILL